MSRNLDAKSKPSRASSSIFLSTTTTSFYSTSAPSTHMAPINEPNGIVFTFPRPQSTVKHFSLCTPVSFMETELCVPPDNLFQVCSRLSLYVVLKNEPSAQIWILVDTPVQYVPRLHI